VAYIELLCGKDNPDVKFTQIDRMRLLWREAVYYDSTDAECGPKGPPLQEPAIMSEAVRTMMRMDARRRRKLPLRRMLDSCGTSGSGSAEYEIRGQKLVTAMLLEVPLVLVEPPRGKCLRCGIRVRIAGFRCRTGGWTGKWWSAATTGGGSMLARDSALRFRRYPARTS